MKNLLFFSLLITTLMLDAQSGNPLYDTDMLSPAFHNGRRIAFREKMAPNSIAFLFANPVRNRNNDVDFQYAQHPDLYYLTGYLEPHAVLIITKDSVEINGARSNEFFFAQQRDPRTEVWTGKRLGAEGVRNELKISAAWTGADFLEASFDLLFGMEKVYATLPTGAVDDGWVKGDLYELVEYFKSKSSYKTLDTEGLSNIMQDLREIKTPEEMVLMRKAIDMSCEGHREVMKFLQPGTTEYQAQAVMEHIFKYYGSEYCGYPSICGAAENSCTLHYVTNRRKLEDGDIYLMDCGAEYHGYMADVTRTIPVNGKFSNEQKIMYELVLKAQDAGIEACQPGKPFRDVNKVATEVIADGLVELGLIKNRSEVRQYFMHGTSHFLGLDVHDPGNGRGNLTPGHVLTVEPGIYIPEGSPCDKKWWNIGIRIEDDVLITENGHEVLSLSAPRSVAEIEKLMREESTFIKKTSN